MFKGQGHGDNFKDEGVDVYEYFNTCCYSGYGDDEEVLYLFISRKKVSSYVYVTNKMLIICCW